MQDDALVAAIPRFEIQYSPSSLLKGEIDTVLLDAPTVHLQYTDGALSVSGLPDTTRSTKKQGNATSFELPVSIKNIHIRNAHLALETESGLNDIVLDSQIELGFAPKKGKTHKLRVQGGPSPLQHRQKESSAHKVYISILNATSQTLWILAISYLQVKAWYLQVLLQPKGR